MQTVAMFPFTSFMVLGNFFPILLFDNHHHHSPRVLKPLLLHAQNDIPLPFQKDICPSSFMKFSVVLQKLFTHNSTKHNAGYWLTYQILIQTKTK